jgi:putative transposase
MPRAHRVVSGGLVYHVLNRANARMRLFAEEADYALMRAVLAEAHERVGMRMLGYCVMPNHFHLLLWPRGDGELSEFMRWLTVTHTQRWHGAHGTAGTGHVYQGRYKSFPVQQMRPSAAAHARGVLEGGDAVLSVLRYIERNPLRAGLVTDAAAWPHSSLADRVGAPAEPPIPLTGSPGGLPRHWVSLVNRPQSEKELAALRRCIQRGRPFGREAWVQRMAAEWGLESTLRPRGRPKTSIKGS